MSASSALARGRRAHEKLMVDRCVIHRIAKSALLNEETGVYDDVLTQVYPPTGSTGPCKVESADLSAREIAAAGQELVDVSKRLDLPIASSTDVEKNDVVTMVSSGNDPDMVGLTLRIEGPDHQTFATARRFRVEEVS